jgi:molybdopterin-guanine dinucleotide biosynthesis protein A
MDAREPVVAAVLVLAGGGSRRLGRDKLTVLLAGRTVLDHLLDGLARAAPDVPLVVVGPRRPTRTPVRWVREDPPGGGPVPALARGIAEIDVEIDAGIDVDLADLDPIVCVVAGDQPFAAPAVPVLVTTLSRLPDVDAVVAMDGAGVDQPLLAGYRLAALRGALGPRPGGAMRAVLASLRVARVAVPAETILDVDTEDDVTRATGIAGAGIAGGGIAAIRARVPRDTQS